MGYKDIDLLAKNRDKFYHDVQISFIKSKENLDKLLKLAKIYIEEHPNLDITVDTTINQDHFWEEIYLNIWFKNLGLVVSFKSCTSPHILKNCLPHKPFWSVSFQGYSGAWLTGLRFPNLDRTNLFLYYITRAQKNEDIGDMVEAYRQKMSFLNDF